MKWYLMILRSLKDVERVEPVLNFAGIKHERTGETRFYIYTSEEEAKRLNSTFEYLTVIRVEVV